MANKWSGVEYTPFVICLIKSKIYFTDGTIKAKQVFAGLKKEFPALEISTIDERFTSRMAKDALLAGGMKKSDRRQKENTDKVSAALILQSYLEQRSRFGSGTQGKPNTNGI